jgi:hypothetical protein
VLIMPGVDTFSKDYAAARSRFLAAVQQHGTLLESAVNPCALGPHGETLACDVAWFGATDATRVVVVFSGIHGTEGAAGSAAQLAWIERHGPQALPPKVAVLMLHALNPWGFAYCSRCNENFVDLNRNFIDHGSPPADAPLSEVVQAAVCVDQLDNATLDRARIEFGKLREQHGEFAIERALWGGQYSRPRGLSFGGQNPQWTNQLLRRVLPAALKNATHVVFIDWHTGVGDFNEVAFILPTPAHASDQRQLAIWWGQDALQAWTRAGLSAQNADGSDMWSAVPGQLRNELAKLIKPQFMAGATVEFGLTLHEDIFAIETVSRFLHITGSHTEPRYAPHLERMLTYSLSTHPLWRATVMTTGARLTQAAAQGLGEL